MQGENLRTTHVAATQLRLFGCWEQAHLYVAPDESEHQAHCRSCIGKVASRLPTAVSAVTEHAVADAYAPADRQADRRPAQQYKGHAADSVTGTA
jgi:hypothetical protein